MDKILNLLSKVPIIGRVTPSQETVNKNVERAKSAGGWVGSLLWAVGTASVLIAIPVSFANDLEKSTLINLLSVAYNVKTQGPTSAYNNPNNFQPLNENMMNFQMLPPAPASK